MCYMSLMILCIVLYLDYMQSFSLCSHSFILLFNTLMVMVYMDAILVLSSLYFSLIPFSNCRYRVHLFYSSVILQNTLLVSLDFMVFVMLIFCLLCFLSFYLSHYLSLYRYLSYNLCMVSFLICSCSSFFLILFLSFYSYCAWSLRWVLSFYLQVLALIYICYRIISISLQSSDSLVLLFSMSIFCLVFIQIINYIPTFIFKMEKTNIIASKKCTSLQEIPTQCPYCRFYRQQINKIQLQLNNKITQISNTQSIWQQLQGNNIIQYLQQELITIRNQYDNVLKRVNAIENANDNLMDVNTQLLRENKKLFTYSQSLQQKLSMKVQEIQEIQNKQNMKLEIVSERDEYNRLYSHITRREQIQEERSQELQRLKMILNKI